MFIAFLSVLFSYAILDFLYINVVASSFYRNELGGILLDKFLILPGVVFYLMYAGVVFYLASYQGFFNGSLKTVLVNSFLLGLLAYGTYNLVNMSVLKSWTYKIVVLDIVWGVSVTMLVALIGYFVLVKFY